ncbi:outer membrane beta-barrel protein [Fibrella sp. WM1]|uniref:outer membrane beta-barrel protein n=1 Tax=Fibrella musci TaxID=3242485 RepID=UPI003521C4C5
MITRYVQLLILTYLLTSGTLLAQSGAKKITVGLKVGANFSKLDNLSYRTPRLDQHGLPVLSGGSIVYDFFQQNDARSAGLVGGLFARFGNRFYVQPELLFSVKGGRFDIIRQGLETESVKVKVGTIDLPVLLGVRLGLLRINAGPMASLTVLDGNLKGTFAQYGSQPIGETAKQATLGYQAGVGLTLAGLQLDLRHEGGFTRTVAVGGATTQPTRSDLWQLTVGFGF